MAVKWSRLKHLFQYSESLISLNDLLYVKLKLARNELYPNAINYKAGSVL